MPVEIPCPGCCFLFRADDEFAGESAPCPHCGAMIAVPTPPRPERITKRIGHTIPARDERVRTDPRDAYAFPPHVHLPIPQHGEPRPIVTVEPDEDHPFYDEEWPLGPAPPPGPRMRALNEVRSSTGRVASLLVEPLKRLQPLCSFVSSTVGCFGLFGAAAYWLVDDYPYPALFVGLVGCLVGYQWVRFLLGMPHDPDEDRSIDSEPLPRRHDDRD